VLNIKDPISLRKDNDNFSTIIDSSRLKCTPNLRDVYDNISDEDYEKMKKCSNPFTNEENEKWCIDFLQNNSNISCCICHVLLFANDKNCIICTNGHRICVPCYVQYYKNLVEPKNSKCPVCNTEVLLFKCKTKDSPPCYLRGYETNGTGMQ
jgi:hypothetical protein